MKSKKSKSRGLIITYWGAGKGKTTATIGLAVRASGYDKKVRIVQFVKGNWVSGEEKALKDSPNISIKKVGRGFVGILNDKKSLKKHIEAARRGLLEARSSYKDRGLYLLILDEILGAIKGHLITQDEVLQLIKQKPSGLHLVLTGRPKYEKIIALSDLVTQFSETKHPYNCGLKAILGLDY